MSAPTISQLLQQAAAPAPNGPAQVLAALESHPHLAKAQDDNGYSLLHAAASYNALDLARTLVTQHHLDVNLPDNDGDTPLFYAETLSAAKCLIEELAADVHVRNHDGDTPLANAHTNAEDGDDHWLAVAHYLATASGGDAAQAEAQAQTEAVHAPPPLPPNVRINMGTMREDEAGSLEDADPDFRRRIEQLASRDDFQGESGQTELRRLVEDAVGGMAGAGSATENSSRRRVD